MSDRVTLEGDELVFDLGRGRGDLRVRVWDGVEGNYEHTKITVQPVEEYDGSVGEDRLQRWIDTGGVVASALRSHGVSLRLRADHPVAVKIGIRAAGGERQNFVTGEAWSIPLNRGPQDYLFIPAGLKVDGKEGVQYGVEIPTPFHDAASGEWPALQLVVVPLREGASATSVPRASNATTRAWDLDDGFGCAAKEPLTGVVRNDPQDLADWDQRNARRCVIRVVRESEIKQSSHPEPSDAEPTRSPGDGLLDVRPRHWPEEPQPYSPDPPCAELLHEFAVPCLATMCVAQFEEPYPTLVVGQVPRGSDRFRGTVDYFRFDGGGFERRAAFEPPYRPMCLAAGDVNADGRTEIILGTGAGDDGGHVHVLGGDGEELWRSSHIGSLRRHSEIAVGDVDGDGYPEIAVAVNWYGRYLTLFEHTRGNEFEEAFRHSEGDGHSVAIGDIDGDGAPEIIYGMGAHDGRIIAFEHGEGGYQRCSQTRPENTYRAYVAAGDLDGDGVDEIVAGWGKKCDGRFTVLEGADVVYRSGAHGPDGKSAATYPAIGKLLPAGGKQVAFRLYDGSGKQYCLLADPLGEAFEDPETIVVADAVGPPLVADIDGDGLDELILAERHGDDHRIAVYRISR